MNNEWPELHWEVEQRLEFIEFELFCEEHAIRGQLKEQFGVSMNQAPTNHNRYIHLPPENMVFNKRARNCERGPAFKSRFLEPNTSRYLAQLRPVADNILDRLGACVDDIPPFASALMAVNGVNPVTLRSVASTKRRSKAIEIKYQSLSSPEPRSRQIAPHAIGFDGFRWHARSVCLADGAYMNCQLSRILGIRGSRESEVPAEDGRNWNTEVTQEIGPNHAPSETQVKRIALVYGMLGGKAKIRARRILLYNTLRLLGLDTHPGTRNLQDQQNVLSNWEVIHKDDG